MNMLNPTDELIDHFSSPLRKPVGGGVHGNVLDCFLLHIEIARKIQGLSSSSSASELPI